MVFILSGILLLLVQFGVVSPIGIIETTYEQYIWLFWISVVFFIVGTANLVARIPRHAKWSEGYTGIITRTVKIDGMQKDFFIKGTGSTPIKTVLVEDWPFEQDPDSKWHIIDNLGNDITNVSLDSIDGTAIVVFEDAT